MNIVLMPANWDDREPALALNEDAAGDITIADLGYRSSDCTESLEEAKRLLIPQAYAPERKDPALRSGKV
jgi:hypothetical protein